MATYKHTPIIFFYTSCLQYWVRRFATARPKSQARTAPRTIPPIGTRARIHESVITYDGHISRPGIRPTELELGPSENSYSRARKRSVIVVLEFSGFHTGCLVTKCFIAHGEGVFVQLDNQVGSDIII